MALLLRLVAVAGFFVAQAFMSGGSSGDGCLWVEHFESENPADGRILGRLTEGRTGKGIAVHNKGEYAVFDRKGKVSVNEGTIDLWVKPNFDGGDRTERTLFDLLGSPPHWNRLFIGIHPTGNLIFDIVRAKDSVENIWAADCYLFGDISTWKKGEWHRITVTWQNINSGEPNGVIRLYVDGKKSGERRDRITITELGKEIFVGSPALNAGADRLWAGVIDEVATYDNVQEHLSPAMAVAGTAARRPREAGVESSVAESSSPVMTVVRTRAAPVIDGELGKDEWKCAASASGFLNLVQGRLSERDVAVYAMYDDQNLHLAFKSVVSGRPRAAMKAHDNSEVCLDDAVEVLLQPDPQNVYHFIGNSIGTVFDTKNDPEGRTPSAWDGRWNFRNKVVDSGETSGGVLTFAKSLWTAEMAIPFATLSVATPKDGECWRANFCRDWSLKRAEEQIRRWTSWSPPYGGAFSNPKGFGLLCFREDSLVVQVESFGKSIAEGDIGIRGAASNFGSKTADLCADLRLLKSGTGEEIVRKSVPLVLKPSEVKALTSDASAELASSAEVTLVFTVRDLNGDETLYRRTFSFVSSPSFKIETSLLYSRGLVDISCSLKSGSGLSSSARAAAEVYTVSGKGPLLRLSFSGFSAKTPTGSCPVDITRLPPGQYRVKGHITDGARVVAQGTAEFTIPKKPEWWGNTLGVSGQVPPPWTPVKVVGKTISVWGRDYQFDEQPFPAQIVTKGKPVLSAPIRLEVVTDKGEVTWTNRSLRCVGESGTKATLRVENRSSQLDLRAAVTVEFDGLTRVDLRLLPKGQTAIIKRLVLKVPLREENALYMKAINLNDWTEDEFGWYAACLYRGAEGKDGDTLTVNRKWHYSAKGWVWPEKFVHYVWVGGDGRGLSVTFDSDRNWQTRKYVEVVESEGAKEVRFNLVSSDYALQQPLDYTLALHATPVKSLPKDPKKWRYSYRANQTPVGLEDMELAVQYGLTRGTGWPELTPKGKELIRLFSEGGVKLTPDFYTNVTTLEMPEFQTFRKEWEAIPRHIWGGEGGTAIMVCMKGSYADFFLWGINRMMDDGLRGLYIDSSGVLACANRHGGCGYVDKDGKVKPTINLFEAREAYKRLYTLFKTRAPGSCIFAHTTPISPLASFVDAATEGEEWTDFKIPDLTYLTPDFFRAGFMMYQSYGLPFCLYPGLPRGFPKQVKRTDLLPLTLSHNIFPLYNDALDQQVWNNVMNEWYTSSEWIPYWKNGNLVQSFGKDVKIGVYRKPDGRSLISVANLANTPREGEVEISLSAFGLNQDNYRLTDIGLGLPNRQVALARSKLRLSLPEHSVRFFLLEKHG